MKHILAFAAIFAAIPVLAQSRGVCVSADGTAYVSAGNRIDKLSDGKAMPFATLKEPGRIAFCRAQNAVLAIDGLTVVKIDGKGKVTTLPAKFPESVKALTDIAVEDFSQMAIVTAVGDDETSGAFTIDLRKGTVKQVAKLKNPTSVAFDGHVHAMLSDSTTLYQANLTDQSLAKLFDGFTGLHSVTWDRHGRLFFATKAGVLAIPRPGQRPIPLPNSATDGDITINANGSSLIAAGQPITTISATIPGWEVDEKPIDIKLEPPFPGMSWTGWDDGSETGKVNEHRPVWLTNAGDGSGRTFVCLQQGQIHITGAKQTKLFLDIMKKVKFLKNQNEEGLLGMAFHPKFKSNGEFFLFYTSAELKMTNVISRFKVDPKDPDRADPASEEILLKIEKPYWNHDGGTIVFGPDGMLYIIHGDGGAGNDPHGNGQNLKTLLGKILRIDVDSKAAGKNYGIPRDNPFLNVDGALPEIYAYGIRNVWRMAFDKTTGKLWAGEVGQNLFEEIFHIERGGNYGWSLRESLHPFGPKGVGVSTKLIDPIWEYHHEVGKSITGGHVYRGTAIPELQGLYLYADYVTPRLWALRYDDARKRVTGNHPLPNPSIAIMSFGEDEAGESYILGATPNGRGLFKLAK